MIAGTIAITQTDIKRVIAYSTMSQIGYMIMGVSVGAYAAGLFHLMTHAFFKALLFMGAGSIIGAMAGEQSLEKMGGFRKAMPFTYGCFIVGGLALSGLPPFSGFFSKDEILLVTGERGGWHWALYVVGYLGALLTAIYTFRMIFRAFHGEPVQRGGGARRRPPAPCRAADEPGERRSRGHRRRLPGPVPHDRRARAADARGDVHPRDRSVRRGTRADPESRLRDRRLPRARRSSARGCTRSHERSGLLVFGIVLGTVLGLLGIAIAYRVWVQRPGTATVVRERLRPAYELFVNKWYFDELIDALVVRPAATIGRFATGTFERVFVDETLIGGTTGLVRIGSAAVRAVQSGFVRYYVALLVLGLTGVGFYFLLQT